MVHLYKCLSMNYEIMGKKITNKTNKNIKWLLKLVHTHDCVYEVKVEV